MEENKKKEPENKPLQSNPNTTGHQSGPQGPNNDRKSGNVPQGPNIFNIIMMIFIITFIVNLVCVK